MQSRKIERMLLEDYKNRIWKVVEYNPQRVEFFELVGVRMSRKKANPFKKILKLINKKGHGYF